MADESSGLADAEDTIADLENQLRIAHSEIKTLRRDPVTGAYRPG